MPTTDADNSGEIDETEKHYYLLQSYGNTGFFMRQNIETTTSTKSDVVTTLNILTDDMKWYFLESGEDGYYYICDINNKYLYFAQPSGNTSSRTWMQLKELDDNDKDHYKFSIAKNNTNGAYNIIPKGNTGTYCLNKRGRNASADGIQILAGYNDENSCWFFIPMSSYKWTLRSDCFRVSDSNIRYYYKIKSQQDASYYIKPGTNYVQTSNVNDDDMIWFFEEADSDDELMTYYYIKHANTEQYLHYNSTSVGQNNAIDLASHTGDETGDDENRFQFIVVRGTNENETLDNPLGIVFNIVPKLLKSTSSDVSIKSVSCDGGKGKALKTKSDRNVNTTHWSFESATFTGAWADPEITCDATGTTGTVTITCSDANTDIYYTTNGDTPIATETDTETNKKYTAPFTVNPGKTIIKARVIKSEKKNSNVVTKTIVLNPTITLSATSYTYTGSAQDPVSSVDYVDAENSENNIHFTETTQYTISYKKGTTAVENCTDAGEYTITLNDVDGDEYFIYGAGSFTIGQKDLTITAKPKEITYGEGPDNDGVEYDSFADNEDTSVLGGTLAYAYNYSQYGDAGSYTITPSGLTSTNYDITFVPGTLTVNPKEVGLTWSTTTSFPYDGVAHALTAEATGTVNDDAIGVTLTTTAKEGSSLTDGNAINAGNYTATASSLTGTKAGNYTLPAANTQDFTIAKIGITPTVTLDGWTYGETAATPSVTGNTGSGAVTYAYKVKDADDATYSETKPTDAGTYTVKASIAATTNYEAATATSDFTIAKATLTASVTLDGWTYGETAATPSVTGNSGNGTVAYTYKVKDADDATYSETKPTDAGTYTVKASIAATTNYEAATVTSDFTIAKATLEASVTLDGWTYGETAATPSVTGNTEDGAVTYMYKVKDAADDTYTETQPSNAGTYTVKASIAATTNYEAATTTTDFTIAQKSLGDGTVPAEGIVINIDAENNISITGMTKGTDYTVSEPVEEEGNQVWTVEGINNYKGAAKVMRISLSLSKTGATSTATESNVEEVTPYQSSVDLVTTGLNPYKVTYVNMTNHTLTIQKLDYVPKDVPVLLLTDIAEFDEEQIYSYAVTPVSVAAADVADTSDNLLKQVTSETGQIVEFGQVYMYYKGKFVITTAGTMEKGKFYVDNPNFQDGGVSNAPLSIMFDETTDVGDVRWMMDDERDDKWYSLDGRRLNGKPTKKGLYLKDGKKIVIK